MAFSRTLAAEFRKILIPKMRLFMKKARRGIIVPRQREKKVPTNIRSFGDVKLKMRD